MAYKFQLGAAKLSGSIEQTGPASDAASLRKITIDDGSTIGVDSVSDVLTMAANGDTTLKTGLDFNIAGHNATNTGLKLNGTLVTATATELNYLDGADSSIASLALPDNTTISTYGASLVDDADAAAARTTLGLVIGTNVQAFDAELAAIAGLTSAADKGIQFTGNGTAATYDLTAFAKTILDDANQGAVQSTLGLVPGTDVQAFDAELAAIAGLASAADKGIQFTGNGTAATYDLTAAGKALLDDADASAQRTTLGLGTIATQAANSVNIDGGDIDGVTIGTNSAVTQLTASNARIDNLDVVTINSVNQTETTLEIEDKKIVSALSASSANASGGGLQIGGGATDGEGHASVLWDHGNSALDFNIGSETQLLLKNGSLNPAADDDITLGGEGAAYKQLFLVAGGLNIGGSNVTSTPQELNFLDAGTAGSSATVLGADSIIIGDSTNSNATKKVLVSDIVTTSSRLSVASERSDGDELQVGMNFFGDLNDSTMVDLPANPTVGDVVYVKAKNFTDPAADIIIIPDSGTSHLIDGSAAIALESPFAAVTLVYVAANDWRIV